MATRRDDGKVRIEVADTGSGLTRRNAKEFHAYYTSKQHGIGLGWPLCSRSSAITWDDQREKRTWAGNNICMIELRKTRIHCMASLLRSGMGEHKL